jgi:uncharacterized protein YjbI with pentapeptide repeats
MFLFRLQKLRLPPLGLHKKARACGSARARANLARANLNRANLARANLNRANLARANLAR